jgi:hypothetical protein
MIFWFGFQISERNAYAPMIPFVSEKKREQWITACRFVLGEEEVQ